MTHPHQKPPRALLTQGNQHSARPTGRRWLSLWQHHAILPGSLSPPRKTTKRSQITKAASRKTSQKQAGEDLGFARFPTRMSGEPMATTLKQRGMPTNAGSLPQPWSSKVDVSLTARVVNTWVGSGLSCWPHSSGTHHTRCKFQSQGLNGGNIPYYHQEGWLLGLVTVTLRGTKDTV